RYTIVDLRPGTYAVTFTLAGFTTFKREGIDVAANVAVPINAELRVGAKRVMTRSLGHVIDTSVEGTFGTPKTEAGVRRVPLSETTVALLTAWRRGVKRTDRRRSCFRRTRGKRFHSTKSSVAS